MKFLSSVITVIVIIGVMLATGCAKKVVTSEIEEGVKAQPVEKQTSPEPEAQQAKPIEKGTVKSEEAAIQATAQKEAAPVAEVKGIADIFFDFDRFSIREDARPTLEDNAKYMKGNNNLKIVIEGHCDERGTPEYNIALGERRAQAAKKYLIDLGIDSSRISVISYGEEKPFCTDHTEECWQENRRARFVEAK